MVGRMLVRPAGVQLDLNGVVKGRGRRPPRATASSQRAATTRDAESTTSHFPAAMRFGSRAAGSRRAGSRGAAGCAPAPGSTIWSTRAAAGRPSRLGPTWPSTRARASRPTSRNRISYTLWRRLHSLNFAVWIAATAHGLGAGTDFGSTAFLLMYALCAGQSPPLPW